MATTYILLCSDNSYYVGSSSDFTRRLIEHQKGKCKYTKSRKPVSVFYTEEYLTLSMAKKREYQIKGWKSRNMIEKLVK